MKVITLVNLQTGEFGTVFTIPRGREVAMLEGFGFIVGRFDRVSQRLDLLTGEVVEQQPEQPDADHEWRPASPQAESRVDQRWRWVKKPEVIERERRSAHLLQEIENIEQLQLRSISDLLDDPNDAMARANYDRRKAEIARLRQMRADVIAGTDR